MSVIEVESIDHITLVVKSLEESRKFYVEMLGMQEVPRPDFNFKGSWFQAGKTLIHLILEHDQSGEAGVPADQKRSTRAHHFAFCIADAQAAWEKLQASEYTLDVISKPKLRPDGAVQFFLADPDGHRVEISSE
ncbi:MAG: VOC family protein [Planctomycetaceae bacterium]|nr:VOC family protein [Planctomycetaceae bacterium]